MQKEGGTVHIECVSAKIAQDFLAEDVPGVLIDLPNLILAEKEYQAAQTDVVRFRVSSADKQVIERKAVAQGFASVSEYMRHLALCA